LARALLRRFDNLPKRDRAMLRLTALAIRSLDVILVALLFTAFS
jgi:hypothetical protein